MSKPTPSPFPIIEGYNIEGVLGRGSTGVVYSAVQLAVDRPVAIKVLHPSLVGSKRHVRRLQREARTAARLAHPGIISAIDMGEQDGVWWYAMELVEGISLAERIEERGPFTEREAVRFFLPLVEALHHAYEGGVVHRDIKPGNILVDAHGKARLVDLGLAISEDDPTITRPGGTLGTPHYISPEQARDPTAADFKSDLWSLGATMFHAVCGRPPFEGASVAEILSGVLHERIPDPRLLAPEMSKGYSLVLRKCLTRDPKGRYRDPASLQEDLERIVERRAVEVRKASLDPVDDGRPSWWRAATIGGPIAAVLLIALFLWKPWEGGDVPEETAERVIAWPALDELEKRYGEGRLTLATASANLAGMSTPEGGEALRDSFASRLQLDLEEALQTLTREFDQAVDVALRRDDLVEAFGLIDTVSDRLARATGYDRVSGVPSSPARARLVTMIERKARKAQDWREEALGGVELALRSHVRSQVIPAIVRARADMRWRDAGDLLDSREDWWEEAGVQAKVTPVDRDVLLNQVEPLLDPIGPTLFTSYESAVDELEEFLRSQDDRLREDLGRGRTGAAGELRARFEEQLVSIGLDEAQIPANYQLQRPLRAELERRAQDLAEDEEALLEDDATRDYQDDLRSSRTFLRRRRYDEAIEFWDERLAEPWRVAVSEDMLQRRREAELLEQLLQDAAAELRRRHGGDLEILLEGIAHRAQVIATRTGPDLARLGFQLDLPQFEEPQRVFLRRMEEANTYVLPAETMLLVAGRDGPSLDRALFLFEEGLLEAAKESLPDGPIEDSVLLAALRIRIDNALAGIVAEAQGREAEKEQLLRRLRRDRDGGRSTSKGMLDQAQHLFDTYSDLLDVSERRELASIIAVCRERLASPTLERLYPGATVEHNGPVATLGWGFEGEVGDEWDLGKWVPLAQEWVMLKAAATEEEFWSEQSAVSLGLQDPLLLDGPLEFELELAWAEDHNTFDNDLVLSIGGVHLCFVDGPKGGEHRWAVAMSGPETALANLRQRAERKFSGFNGFPRDEAFTLRVTLNPARGRMQVFVNDEPLELPREMGRFELSNSPRLSLRSRYLMSLGGLQVTARTR